MPSSGYLPACYVERKDVSGVIVRICWALREAGFDERADDFLKRAVAFSAFDDITHLASKYVEICWVDQ